MKQTKKLRVGLVMPHIFMHKDILPRTIFAPGQLALDLANGLRDEDIDTTFFSPGPVDGAFKNITADLTYFEAELKARGDSYLDLLKKHPFTFITLARQVQSEIIARAYQMANNDQVDVIHIYGNEEDTALPFAAFCQKPIVFTHHDPYNFLVKYRSVFPKYKHLNWLSLSLAQRETMPSGTNWVGNVYHGLDPAKWQPCFTPGSYVAYLGRIIEPKGVYLAIQSVKLYNQSHPTTPLRLKIAGKHYFSQTKDSYWKKMIEPELTDPNIEYVGFIKDLEEKQAFLGNAKALLVPSLFNEPFGMVMIEALACGTPLLGLNSGAIPEIIKDGSNGFLVKKTYKKLGKKAELNEKQVTKNIEDAFTKLGQLDRRHCRRYFETRFTLDRMIKQHAKLYKKLAKK